MTSGHNKEALLHQSARGKEAHTVDDEDDDHENAKRGTKAHSAALVMLSTLGFLIPGPMVRSLPRPLPMSGPYRNSLSTFLSGWMCLGPFCWPKSANVTEFVLQSELAEVADYFYVAQYFHIIYIILYKFSNFQNILFFRRAKFCEGKLKNFLECVGVC